jgi:uncharacterized protein YggE
MKKILPTLFLILFFQAVVAQQPIYTSNPYPKTITVSGSAEMEVVPDQINVNIQLKEYQKKGDNKKDLETIKAHFLGSARSLGIADSLISIVSYSGQGDYYTSKKKKKDPDLLASITYQVRFSSSRLMDQLVEKLDDEATQSFAIVSVSHSKLLEYRKQLKIRAIQAAKEKGIYLSEAINESLGNAVTINEPDEWNPYVMDNVRMNTQVSNATMDHGGGFSEIDFKKMKLKFNVSVVFALK